MLCIVTDAAMSCAACTPDGNGITYNDSVNVALAVSMPDGGLITPVIQVSHACRLARRRFWDAAVACGV